MEKYKKIEFAAGDTVEKAVNKLLEYNKKGQLVYGEFNGHKLYSDTVTMDSAYKEIVGQTESEYFNKQQKVIDNLKKQDEEFKKRIPQLSKDWKEKGRTILTKDKLEFWDEIVPIRLNDLYRGMELGCCLDIVKILNNNGTLEEAKKKIESQNHSGMSFSLVCAMVQEFSKRGKEFVEYVK